MAARSVFKVLRVNPEIQKRVKKHPVYDRGELVSLRDEEILFQTGVAVDGTKFENELCEYSFSAPPGYVQPGDTITADVTTSMEILDVFVESGVNSSAPVKHVPERIVPFNPNAAGENQPFAAPEGAALSPNDIDVMLRGQAKLITELTNRVRKLEAFAPRHCDRCKLHIEENAFAVK
jgi:hypothetical protein